MDKPESVIRLLLDPLSLKIAKKAVYEEKSPTKIAAEIGKSTSLVFLRLKEMEETGIIESKFRIKKGKITKKYALPVQRLLIRADVDFKEGSARIIQDKTDAIEKAVAGMPELFDSYDDFLIWKKNLVSAKDITEKLGVKEEDAGEIKEEITNNLEEAFLIAKRHEIREWHERGEDGLIEFKDDYLVVPSGRFWEKTKKDKSLKELGEILSQGEVFLSSLQPKFTDEVKKLSEERVLYTEEVRRPALDFNMVNNITKKAVGKDNWESSLLSMGKRIGSLILKSSEASPRAALNAIFGQGNVILNSEGMKIMECDVCSGLSGEKVCFFISGLVEGLLAGEALEAEAREVACSAAGDVVCNFVLKKTPSTNITGFQKVKDLLG